MLNKDPNKINEEIEKIKAKFDEKEKIIEE